MIPMKRPDGLAGATLVLARLAPCVSDAQPPMTRKAAVTRFRLHDSGADGGFLGGPIVEMPERQPGDGGIST